ncbi:MAG: PD-(D/E)XK nuclease family protein [Bacteroidota bacterium]
MRSFLEEVIEEINNGDEALENIVFILPSKRAGTFLRNIIAKTAKKNLFSPRIYSIEAFVEKISGLTYASNIQLLFELYDTYLRETRGEKDTFHSFSKWGQTLLQDFNEIDRYLVDPTKIFSHLSAVQDVNHWYVQKERTQVIENYITFWENLENLYVAFTTSLLNKGIGHQGLVYRQAHNKLDQYLEANKHWKHVFIGFNALNTAEANIIQKFLEVVVSDIYWDIDPYFLNDPIHDAGYFIRKHKKSWNYFEEHPLKGIKEGYVLQKKNINVIGVPKSVSQAKYISHLIGEINSKEPESLKNMAVVLGDETLLNPILNSIPKEIEGINITMGYPLSKIPMASLFTQFFDLYLNKESHGWFYKHLLAFISHPDIHTLLTGKHGNIGELLNKKIKNQNWAYITIEKIKSIAQEDPNGVSYLFSVKNSSPIGFIESCLDIIQELRTKFQTSGNSLGLEYLYRFYTLFNELRQLVVHYNFVADLKSLYALYKELLSSETLDFQGEPLKGLQIMGMLESRNLDFETVLISSVNEGILPAGKSNNSFVPFDVKLAYNLPTYKEKDAVFTYHFYRLLQRAKNVYLLYNTEPDVLEGGEKSRLITQLQTDKNILPQITEIIASPKIIPPNKALQRIHKDADLMQRIAVFAKKGFSPTSLTNYVRNPVDFYKKSILKIEDIVEVEETVAANTFGTIVHDTLEELYTPLIGQNLGKENLTHLKPKIHTTVQRHFAKSYADGDITRGKNLIAFNVIIRYVENFLDLEIKSAENHEIKILGLEESLEMQMNIPELDFPIFIRGKLDRIDEKDGTIRIIDFKTGKASSPQVEVVHWEDLITDYDHSKAFQLLCYALMYTNKRSIKTLEAGIISFKNLSAGLLCFAVKDKKGGRNKNTTIDADILQLFYQQLKKLILEICDSDIPFIEKEV